MTRLVEAVRTVAPRAEVQGSRTLRSLVMMPVTVYRASAPA
ncbi:MAG TPA: hypothetical protein VK858_16745 [Longimicrobiales bacterium]|nr:hypothetical protein [Longimicrobiales bacterium]